MNILSLSNSKKTISNADISSESLEIVESLCSEEYLLFGSCEPSVLTLRIRSDESVKGEKFDVTMQEGSKVTSLGSFTVYEEELTADRCYRDIEAYNGMYEIINANVADWYNALNFPMTMKAFRDSFFNHLGVVQDSITLPNDSMIIERTISSDEISGQTVVTCICEMNGCLGHVDRSNKFVYVFLNPLDLHVITKDHIKSAEYEDFTTCAIDMLQIRKEEDDIGVIVGSGDNCYIIQDNFLVYGKSSAELNGIASNILNSINGIVYKPFIMNASGDLDVTLGTAVSFSSSDQSISSYILQRTISGIQSITDTYQAQGKEFQDEKVKSVHDSIIELKGKSNVLKRTIEELSVTIEDKERGLNSKIEQTAESITAEVKRATDAEGVLSSRIAATDSKISLEVSKLQQEIDGDIKTYNVDYVPTLTNYPAWDFTYNIPCDNTVQLSDTLQFEYKDSYYQKNARTMVFNSTTFVSYKFIKNGDSGQWYWREIAESEYSYVLQQIAELKIEADNITATVTENRRYSDGKLEELSSQIKQTAESITLEVKRASDEEGRLSSRITQTAEAITSEVRRASEAEGSLSSRITQTAESISSEVRRATDAEGSLSSRITQTAESITSEIQRASEAEGLLSSSIEQTAEAIKSKVSKGNISSEISQEAGQITIRSNRFVLESTNCSISKNGTITASNVELSGKITASSGKIGGFTIDKDGLAASSYSNSISVKPEGINIKGGSGEFDAKNDGSVTIRCYSSKGLKIESRTSDNDSVEITPDALSIYDYSQRLSTKYNHNSIEFGADFYLKSFAYKLIEGNLMKLTLHQNVIVGDSNKKVGFFGSEGSAKRSVDKITLTSPTTTDLKNKVNDILTALKAYGLV